MINAVPKIQQNPRTVSGNATHYGYVAFHDIALGPDHRVQPEKSPYYHNLPCRELIPFTNIEIGEIDNKLYGQERNVSPVVRKPKSAYDCAFEMESSYEAWAFQILRPLTGYAEEDAFRIFQTVQPFHYKLKDIQYQVGTMGLVRIDATAPFTATYEGESVQLEPLAESEKQIAREVLNLLMASIDMAVELGRDKQQKTITSMTKAFAGGDGKVTPDPLDQYLATEFGVKLPQLVDLESTEETVDVKAVEELTLRREELAVRKQELELRAKEIELKEKEENRRKMEAVRAGKKKEDAEV